MRVGRFKPCFWPLQATASLVAVMLESCAKPTTCGAFLKSKPLPS